MSSVLRRIKGVDDGTMEGLHDFPEFRAFELVDLAPPTTATAIVSPTGRDAGGRRRALCVGINDYRDRPLAGCVNDARAWAEGLQRVGFLVDQLLDGQATRSAIVTALGDLVGAARAGDVLVFQYAGHGSQAIDRNGDEGDGFDEAFVPVDYHLGHYLLDDDLAVIVAKLPAGAQLTLFMDCCHSGTISRFSPAIAPQLGMDERVRYLPMSAELQRAHDEFRQSLASRDPIPEGALPGVVHFAACRDEEYAYESGGSGDFTRAGTALLVAAVERQDTNEAFIEAIRADVGRRGRQHPGLMRLAPGLERRPLLGGSSGQPGTDGAFTGMDDAALLAQVESMAAVLRARLRRQGA
jgi:hypothetical protein